MFEQCKMSSLSAAPSSPEFCRSELLLASSEPQPISRASETLASLEGPPIPSVSSGGQSQSQKKRRLTGTALSKPAAQSLTSPVLVSWRPFHARTTSEISEPSCGGEKCAEAWQTPSLGGWSVGKSQPTIFGKRDGAGKIFGTRCHYEESTRSQSWLWQLPCFFLRDMHVLFNIGTARDQTQLKTHRCTFANHPYSTHLSPSSMSDPINHTHSTRQFRS